jgi:hypothetical protein
VSGPPPEISEREIRDALRRVLPNTHLPTPAGRVAVSREAVLDELGLGPGEKGDFVDELLEDRGVEVLAVERTRSLSKTLGAEAALKPGPAPTLFYVVPEELHGS